MFVEKEWAYQRPQIQPAEEMDHIWAAIRRDLLN